MSLVARIGAIPKRSWLEPNLYLEQLQTFFFINKNYTFKKLYNLQLNCLQSLEIKSDFKYYEIEIDRQSYEYSLVVISGTGAVSAY